ncbi:MAG: hypoxanthine phosphoribosyltransferase [Myxococcales bacterium SG8_38]|nr:MAG: hypoxanthine phosphoribosyltransferase [Myxococcales bacterium SG8_38]
MPLKPLIDAGTIARRVAELGRAITDDYLGEDLVLIAVLKGSYVFAADLARHIDLDLSIDFLGVRSYADDQQSSGIVQITADLTQSIEGKHVIVVEDIVDTGLTVSYLYENLETRRPASIKLASLLHKPARTQVPVRIDYLGFTIDDVFVVGYGLDYRQRFRNLPYLAAIADGTA